MKKGPLVDFSLSVEQQDLARTLEAMLTRLGGLDACRTAVEEDPSAAEPLWNGLAEMGLISLAVDESVGGAGLLPIELCLVHEALGRHLAPVPFLPTLLAARALSRCRPDAVRDELLGQVLDGGLRLAEFVGTDAVSSTVEVGRDVDGRLVASGGVDAVWSAATIDGLLLVADVDGGPRLLHVAVDRERSRPQSQALDVSRLAGRVEFDAAPAHELVPVDGLASLREELRSLGRLLLAAEQLGVASASIDSGAQWARERHQFGRPIGSFQAIKHRLVNAYNDMTSAWTLVYLAAWSLATGARSTADDVEEALVAANDAAMNAAGSALQVHGGIGFTWEHRSHLYLRRARANSQVHGRRSAHLEHIATRVLGQES